MKSRQKNWRESRSRETEVGEKIAVTTGEAVGVLAFDFSAAFDCIAYTTLLNKLESATLLLPCLPVFAFSAENGKVLRVWHVSPSADDS